MIRERLSTKPNYTIIFGNEQGQVGKLDFNGPEMIFEGHAAESANIFFKWVAASFTGRLIEERHKAVEEIKRELFHVLPDQVHESVNSVIDQYVDKKYGQEIPFEREHRYIVVKLTDLERARKIISKEDMVVFEDVLRKVNRARAYTGKQPLTCVVVENDWPEYEPTWKAIEQRMEGTTKYPIPEFLRNQDNLKRERAAVPHRCPYCGNLTYAPIEAPNDYCHHDIIKE